MQKGAWQSNRAKNNGHLFTNFTSFAYAVDGKLSIISFYLREWVVNGLEDLEGINMADAAMERVPQGKEAIVFSTKGRSDLGLDH